MQQKDIYRRTAAKLCDIFPRLAVYESSFLDRRLEWGDFVHISEGKSALKLLQTTTVKAAITER